MCNIAAYVGEKNAAPILIEMMLKEEGFDAGYYTGIATLHEGKIYYAKLMGDMQRLLNLTDAAKLPGNIGIIHSRTKSGGGDAWSHPFIAEKDGEPYLAYVANGSAGIFKEQLPQSQRYAQLLADEGYNMHSREVLSLNKYLTLSDGTSVHSSDATAQMILRNILHGADLPDAMEQALCSLLSEDVGLALSLSEPNGVGFSRINQPMQVSFVEHGVYIGTTAMAFPEDAKNVQTLPPLSSGCIYRDNLVVASYQNPPCEVSEIDENITNSAKKVIELALKENKQSISDLRMLVKPLFGSTQSVPASLLVYEIIRELKYRNLIFMETVWMEGVEEGLVAPKIQMWM